MAFRILSLDGGGTWALIEVMTLIRLYGENTKGRDVLRDFDLVAASSGGSIVLGALLEDLTLGKTRDYFLDLHQRQALFSPGGGLAEKVLNFVGVGPKYATAPKLLALERLMPTTGTKPLAGLTAGLRRPGGDDLRVLIVGFDYDHDRAVFFRSHATHSVAWGKSDHADKVTLAEAIHASSTAPVNFFDSPAEFESSPGRYWDGGVTGQNNPVLAAVIEAVQGGQDPKNISALSLGTGTVCLPDAADPDSPQVYEAAPVDQNLVNDLKKLAKSILDDPPDASSFIAHVMTYAAENAQVLGQVSRIVRMSPMIAPLGNPQGWSLPGGMSATQFRALLGVPMDAISPSEIQSILALASAWLNGQVSNQPIRMDRGTWTWELGQDKAEAAFAAWRAIANAPPFPTLVAAAAGSKTV